ncbi:T9SS type A sorting domain-containing protein [Candidatus Poribacteria bacterium]|nr:T9SS type A sorting domain-containing protein [Candidatus Poribacteria bacterium]
MFSKKNLYLNENIMSTVNVPTSQRVTNGLRIYFCLFLAFCLLLFPLSLAQAQVKEEWVVRYNGWLDGASAIAVDDFGNIYVTGSSYKNATYEDYATVKYDEDGNELWVAIYNGSGNAWDLASAIAVDDSGNVYVTGYSYGGGMTQDDYATVKYDKDGNEAWVARYDGWGSEDWAHAIAVDDSGNVYVTGNSISVTWHDYVTIKYDKDGNEIWVARYTEPFRGSDIPSAIAVDDFGNVYVTGLRNEKGDTSSDYATVKYDNNGNELWVVRYNGPGNSDDIAVAIVVDDFGNVYVTGRSYGGEMTQDDYATIKYSQQSVGQGSIKGVVADTAGNPIERAFVITIKPIKKWALTKPDGSYEITELEPGEYFMIAIKEGYKASLAKVTVEANKVTEHDFILKPKSDETGEDEMIALSNFPNPFNPDTWIPYYLPQDADVTIQIYNSVGQLVRTLNLGRKSAGIYLDKNQAAYWNGCDSLGNKVSSGMYFYTLQAGEFKATRKMVIMK